ncbi:MAG: protein-methionine-sulfoxide reductase catalytic subunit MsrP [Deltaproteobacteria bacterium]|nr:protein-methionine-sulfoxide reductase catalytic subunit MsrP [Deltaproteobacteria bacterium]
MVAIRIARAWELPERVATPEPVFLDRRQFLKTAGATSLALLGACAGNGESTAGPPASAPQSASTAITGLFPAARNSRFSLDRPLTDEHAAGHYNNFYEFTPDKDVYKFTGNFHPWPWQIEATGLVEKEQRWDVAQLARALPLEERLYRHRCVEAWAMAIPWTGFALKALIEKAKPLSSAKYIRFVSFLRPEQAPGQLLRDYPWPYYEGLSLAEATNELAFAALGAYGHELPAQHGAPLRLAIPWKYGYKSPKSIVRIEFVAAPPRTFWNDLAPQEYSFESNVNPAVPHPRWSQASERMLGTGERRPTQLYNGYAEFVAHLYRPA